MEQVRVLHSAQRFDECLDAGLPEQGDVEIILKENGTQSGLPIVMLTWTARMPDGSTHRVQATTTSRLFVTAGMAIAGHHERLTGEVLIPRPNETNPEQPKEPQ